MTATRGKPRIYDCDNCGRRHIGIMEDCGHWDTGPEWDFIWTDWHGVQRVCPKCKDRRDPCCPDECWRCNR